MQVEQPGDPVWSYVLQGFGVFLGVLAGTAITLLVGLWNERKLRGKKLRNLKYEFRLNLAQMDEWLEELARYRNAVNGDRISEYFGYFPLSKFLIPTANDMFMGGQLYEELDQDEIAALVQISRDFSLHGENYINNHIVQRQLDQDRAQATRDIDFWEGKIRAHRNTMSGILNRLEVGRKRYLKGD